MLIEFRDKMVPLTLFRMSPLTQNLSHISYNDKTWQSYTLPKEDPGNI